MYKLLLMLTSTIVLLVVPYTGSANNYDLEAKAALALALATKTPDDGAVPFLTDYREASEKAAKESKPLCVWVAYKCPSSANQIPHAVHVFLDTFQGDKTQRVVCGVPNGKGWLNLSGTVMAPDCCATAIESLIGTASHNHSSTHQTHSNWGPPVVPVMQPIPQSGTKIQMQFRGGGAYA